MYNTGMPVSTHAPSSPRLISDAPLLGVTTSATGLLWRSRCLDERLAAAMAQQHGLPDILARILVGRGVGLEEVEAYLNPTLKDSMPDPAHLRDMDKAVARLLQAVEKKETIGIFGDYDVDGATSSALLLRYFRALGMEAHAYIPDRQKEGYGPNIQGMRALKAQGCSLILTVDCGALAYEPLAQAKAEGLEVIVLDHHMGAAELPEAVAVVNPNRLDETSPLTYLAAVGVVFMTLVALNRALKEHHASPNRHPRGSGDPYPQTGVMDSRLRGNDKEARQGYRPNLISFLDLVALGTICDVVPLVGLNRAFVTQGLKILATRNNTGLRLLSDHARISEAPGAYHCGFILGPRINAGGRVGRAGLGMELLSGEEETMLAAIAAELSAYNEQRRAIEEQVLEEATAQAERQSNHAMLMVAGEGWHEGVIGIVAGRLKERFDRPAAVLALSRGIAKGSARSVPGVDLGAAVIAARAQGLLLAGGGHAMAAGFSLQQAHIPDLHAFFESRMREDVASYLSERHLSLDGCVSPAALTVELARELQRAAPYGMGNPTPRIAVTGARIVKLDILKEQHLRLILEGGAKAMAFRAVGSPLGDFLMKSGARRVHLAGSLKLDTWQGREQVSFHIDDAAEA